MKAQAALQRATGGILEALGVSLDQALKARP
jgi:hypothetical protein